jgi:tripartite-type tricarboxylate transporter receptor subunit TctC
MRRNGIFVLIFGLMICASASAQTYPSHPIRFVVPASAGSVADVIARKLSDTMSKSLGQPMVVDNRPGAKGFIAAEAVARAAPDGYTVFYAFQSILCANPALFEKLPYDPVRDFAPITLMVRGYPILLVNPQLPVKNLAEFIEYAKARPRKVTYGSSGIGATGHLAGAILEQLTGIEMVHIPYKNVPQLINDLIAGQIDAGIEFAGVAAPHIKAGKIRALTIAGPQRKPIISDVPTAAELGLPAFEIASWGGFMAPAGTPREIIDRLNQEMVAALKQPQFVEWLTGLGGEILPGTPGEFAAYIKAQTPKFAKTIKSANIRIE